MFWSIPSARSEERGHYLPTLDGWRAIAISMVVASHGFTIESARDGGGGLLNQFAFRLGTLGVMVFFAISGFLICTRLLVDEERGTGSLRSFYVRRVFRIVPAAYVYLAVGSMLALAGVIVVPWVDIATSAFFLANYIVAQSWFTGHFWSLAIEEHFYLLWPPLLVKFGRRRALWIAVLLIALTVLMRLFTTASAPSGTDLPGYTQLRLDSFMFPCILAIVFRNKSTAERFRRFMAPLMWCGVVVLVAAGIALASRVPGWREPQRLLQSAALSVIVVTTVIRPDDWLGRFLRLPPLEWLGRVSYSVYLWQQLVFGFAPRDWNSRLVALPFLIAAILVLAAISRRWIELPMIALGRRFAGPVSPRPATEHQVL